MTPETYRYYRLDKAGHLDMGDWFEAADDQDAKKEIRTKHPDAMCEIWQASRLVGKVRPRDFDPDDQCFRMR